MISNNYRMSSPSTALALSENDMARFAPSIFAPAAHSSRSARYAYIPTIDVVRGLQKEGFSVMQASQSRCRLEDKRDYTKHMLRLRHDALIARSKGDDVNEVILINSHDGSSAYKMMAGCFRFVCSNGMVTGNLVDEVRVKHSGEVIGEVVDGAFRILSGFDAVDASKDAMKALRLTNGEQDAFARASLALRYPDHENDVPVRTDQVLSARRYEDRDASLWNTFQRVQENLVQGGLRMSDRTRRTRTRGVNGIDGNVALNRGLWVLAEEMRKLHDAL